MGTGKNGVKAELRDLTVILLNAGPAAERDWIDRLFQGVNVTYIRSPDFSDIRPNALYCYYNDKAMALPQRFLSEVAKLDGCGLMHLGDEYFRGDFRNYACFDYVIRNCAAPMLDGPGMLQFPIGATNNMPPLPFVPASQRKFVWSFVGGWRPGRARIAALFADLRPNLLSLPDTQRGEKHIPRAQFLDSLAQSVFIPCGEGNVMLETYRPYEALEYGAVPILPKRRFGDIYSYVFGPDHPLPQFYTWDQAADYIRRMKDDKEALDELQARVVEWWAVEKDSWTSRLQTFIAEGSSGVHRDGLRSRFRSWNGPLHTPERMWELIRQQSFSQLTGRIAAIPGRLAKRAMGKSDKGVWALDDKANGLVSNAIDGKDKPTI